MQISYATLQDLLQQAYHEGLDQGRKTAYQEASQQTEQRAQMQGLSGISGGRG